MAGQVFAIASGKGGVGKTTTVVNLGVVLRRADHSVALVDADLGMANLGPMLGVSSELTLHDVLSGAAAVEDALVEEAPGFAVLPGSNTLADYPDADPANLGDVLETLAETYDFVLVDTGAGMSHEDVLPLGLADQVVLVASPDPAAVGDTRKTAELAGLARGAIAGLVVNKAEPDTDAKHVASQVGVDLLGVVPYDATVRESTASGRPLEAMDPDTPAAAAYREIAGLLADGSLDPLRQAPTADEESAPEETAPSADAGGDAAAEETPAGEDESGAGSPADDDTEGGTTEASESVSGGDEEADPVEASGADETADSAEEDADEDREPEESRESEDGPTDSPEEEEVEEEEDYLAEFEDDEPESKGGFLSRIGRLFR